MGIWEFWLWLGLGAMGIAGAVAIAALICDAWARRKPAKAKASKPRPKPKAPQRPRMKGEWGPPPPRKKAPQWHEWETKTTSLFFGDAGGKNNIELSGSHVKFSKNDEVVYEGPLDDAPDDVIRAVRSFRQGIGKFDFDAFDGISESFRDGMDKFRKDMDKFRDDMDDLGKETDKP